MEIICFGQSTLPKYCSRMFDSEKRIPLVSRVGYPPNVPQARSIEIVLIVLE